MNTELKPISSAVQADCWALQCALKPSREPARSEGAGLCACVLVCVCVRACVCVHLCRFDVIVFSVCLTHLCTS